MSFGLADDARHLFRPASKFRRQDAVPAVDCPSRRPAIRRHDHARMDGYRWRPAGRPTRSRRDLQACDAAQEAYCRNSLCSSPIPSIATVTMLTGSFIAPTPIDVPQQIKSPGSSVMSCEILLTSCRALKIISEIG